MKNSVHSLTRCSLPVILLLACVALPAAHLLAQDAEPPDGSFVIEAEDWNFDGGKFIDNPGIGFGGDSYFGRGIDLGEPGVDFHENTPAVRVGNEQADGYRAPVFPEEVGLPQTVASQDAQRQKFEGKSLPDYDLTLVEPGEWVNYTRTFPAGHYEVRARVRNAGAGAFFARVDEVTGNRGEPSQATRVRGYLLGEAGDSDYGWVTMTDIAGEPVTVTLDGVQTIRVTAVDGAYHANYFALVPMAAPLALPGTADIVNPEPDEGVAPGTNLQIDAAGNDLEGIVSVGFLAIGLSGGTIAIGEDTAAPYSLTWNAVPEGTYDLVTRATDANGVVSESPRVRIFVDGTAPEVVAAAGDGSLKAVDVTFNEPLRAGSVDPANFTITAGGESVAVTAAELQADGVTVRLTTAQQSLGTEYTLAIANVRDRGNNAVEEGTTIRFHGVGPLLQTEAGFVVFEAEAYDRNLDGLWFEDTLRGNPSGGVSMVNPNGAGGSEGSTKIEFDIKFVKTGTHYLWYRASSDSGTDDSAWLHLDGERPLERQDANRASMSGFSTQTDFVWRSNPQDGGGLMTFEIAEAGLHSIGIARREDGAFFDKFVITTDPGFDPLQFGDFGPETTGREGEPVEGGAELEITQQPASVTALEGTAALLAVEATVTEGFLVSQQWQRFDGDDWLDIAGATSTTFRVDPLTFDWNGAELRVRVLTTGAEAVSETVTITVIAETTPPALLRASGLAVTERVLLQFSEEVLEAEAANAASYAITGPNPVEIVSVRLLPGGRSVEIVTDGQVVGEKYTLTVTGLKDTAAVPNLLENGIARFYSLGNLLPQDDNGLLVFEAESYTTNVDGLWVEERTRGIPSGGVAMVVPNGAGGNEAGTQLEYELEFTQTGEHILWYRAGGDSGTDDSSWLWVDGARPAGREDGNLASMSGFNGELDYRWLSNPQEGGGMMTFEIGTAGTHILALARREDGSHFDKFVITTDFGFDPRDFGSFGPPESREGVLPLPSIEITAPDFGEDFQTGSSVTFEVTVSDSPRVIDRVEFHAAGERIGAATAAPWSFTWRNLPEGIWDVTAVVIDDVADSMRSEPVEVFVSGEPVVEGDPLVITGIAFAAPGAFTIEWIGGRAPYTIQMLDGIIWDDVQTTNETSANLTVDAPEGIFRVTSE